MCDQITMYFCVSLIRLGRIAFLLTLACNNFPLIATQTDVIEESPHPCDRTCVEKSKPMTCNFKFKIELYYVLSLACFNCPVNVSHCYLPDCIAADGSNKSLTVVNRKLPGPTIEVCENDTVIVDVENEASPQTTTIHWHGILQKNYQFMDGMPMVTQCPIQPFSTFRYKFTVPDSGTHFYHSHSTPQKNDGLFGSFIVRQPGDEKTYKYDYDLTEHVMMVNDWFDISTTEQFARIQFHNIFPQFLAILVNGRGRQEAVIGPDGQKYLTPLSQFRVKRGKRYRFRVISAAAECAIQISIEGHRLEVIATDGRPVAPMMVDAFNIYSGERYDFILTANNTVANYWMKFRGLEACGFERVYQVAILRYDGAPIKDPPGIPSYDFTRPKGYILNPVTADNRTLNGIVTTLTSTLADDETLLRQPDTQVTLRYDFRTINDTIYNRPIYAHNMSADLFHSRILLPMFNYIYLKMPPSPLLSEYDRIPQSMLCDEDSLDDQGRDCTVEFCDCTHVIKVPLNSVVQVLLIDDGLALTGGQNHPIHLHGYTFRVVAMGRFPANTTTLELVDKEVKRLEALAASNKLVQRLKGAVSKDTLNVPNGGYALIRFYTDNPGFWFLHCHIDLHMDLGLGLVFQTGNQPDFPKPPPNFPKCGNFLRRKRNI